MKMPFTTDQFMEVFKNYNLSIWPLQILFYMLALLALLLVIIDIPLTNKINAAILAFFWLWMGLVYHILYFSAINPAAYIFGGAFILQGFLFIYLGVIRNKISFRLHIDFYSITGGLFIIFSLALYPMTGYLLGHVYPASPTFGLPCPTTIFTFGLLLLTDKKVPVSLLIIPLLWSVLGFSAAFALGIREDAGLLAAGIIFLASLVFRNRQLAILKSPGI
jgi:hypothetical protein